MPLEFNLKRLDEVFRSYYTVTNCRVAIFDDEGAEVLSYPRQLCGICKALRACPEVDAKCRAMDRRALEQARRQRSTYIYECDMGLYEAVSPILQQGSLIGYVMIGQLVDGNNRDRVVRKCSPYIGDSRRLEELLQNGETLNREKLKAGAVLMSVCAEYLCLTKDIKRKQKHIFMVMRGYIQRHLGERLTVEGLCREFGYSRTALFNLFREMEGMGVLEAVNRMRMEQARLLLLQTELAVSEIAASVGIADGNYFTRLFKRYYHRTPTACRREEREEIHV